MPAQTQELNINDLLAQSGNDGTKKRSKLLRDQMRAKQRINSPAPALRDLPTQSANKEISPVLRDLPQHAANTEQPSGEQANEEGNLGAANKQDEQAQGGEKKEDKIGMLQFKKRKNAIKELRKFDKELKKLEKLNDKYKSTNFFFLAILACFIEIIDIPINFCWYTIVLIPVGVILTIMNWMASLFIYIKIHKIKNEQKTKDAWWWTLFALVFKIIPVLNLLPETLERVHIAHNAAKAEFEKREGEIKKIEEKMNKLIKQLG